MCRLLLTPSSINQSRSSPYRWLKFIINFVNYFITGYDAALYSAATSYYQQQQQAAKTTSTWQVKKAGQTGKAKPKIPPKQPQLHYCDVCKISCAGPQVRNVVVVYSKYYSVGVFGSFLSRYTKLFMSDLPWRLIRNFMDGNREKAW